MATLQQLETALINAHNAGDALAARSLANAIINERELRERDPRLEVMEQIPVIGEPGIAQQVQGTVQVSDEPSAIEKAAGVGETALTVATGATSGTLGMIGGTLKGIANEILLGEFGTQAATKRIEQEAMKGLEALTYAPRTEPGQEYTEVVGEIGQLLAPIAPLAQTQTVGAAARLGARAAREAATRRPPPLTIDDLPAIQRQLRAETLPVPIKLTEGQRLRKFDPQRFEREAAKLPEIGEPLRERFLQQNELMRQNFDLFIDKTGAKLSDLRGIGEIVDKALRQRAARHKTKIRTLYKQAEKAGEMEAKVVLPQLAKHLNDSVPESEVANVLKAARAKALKLKAVVERPDKELMPIPISLKNAELLRRSINDATNFEPTNIRQTTIMKKLIDDDTDGVGGKLYKKARAARTRYAKDYENITLIKQLMNTKRGTDDRMVAMEEVLNKSIVSPSAPLDTVRHLRKLLQTEGETGKQAWHELQGGTLKHIRDQALKNVTTDEAGNRIMSPSQLDRVITQLDKSGKLDFIFTKKGAKQLRVINQVAKDVLTTVPNATNTSNTATVLALLSDIGVSGLAGVPLPLLSSFRFLFQSIKDAKLKTRVKEALGD